jgi:hypothetical protein
MVDPNPARGMPLQLQRYWLTGKGAAKIRWGMPHDFNRCVRNLRKYFPTNPEGLCNILHQKRLGAAPGKGHGHSLSAASSLLGGDQEYSRDALVAATKLLERQPKLGKYAWAGPLAPFSVPTGEPRRTRIFEPDSLSHRMLPLPLDWRQKTAQGHEGAMTVGRILGITYGPDEQERDFAWGWGDFLDEEIIPEAAKARYLMEMGVAGSSVDPGGRVVATMNPETGAEHMMRFTIGGATLVPIPAFSGMHLYTFDTDGDWPDDDPDYTADLDSDDCGCGDRLTTDLDAEDSFAVNPSGWRGLPLAPRNSVFDNDDAVKRIAAWAATPQGPDVAKLRRAFMWHDTRMPETDTTSYRLPVGDVINGELTLIYHAIYAAAALLSGAHGGLPNVPEPDKGALRRVISEIYPVMAQEFNDATIRAPWDRSAQPGVQMSIDQRDEYAMSDYPVQPPAQWFQNPSLAGKTPLTVTADGKVFGHIAAWDECHRDFVARRECVLPPRSQKGYAPFHLGSVVTAEGDTVRVGKIVMDTRHADINLGYSSAALHYDNTGDEVAVVRAGEDEYGVWVAGAIVPEATPAKVAKLRRSPISGDWRRVEGNLELTAALAVNVPAFPVYAMDGDDRLALVAAGSLEPGGDLEPEVPPTGILDMNLVAAMVREEIGRQEAREDRRARLLDLIDDEQIYQQRERAARFSLLAAAAAEEPAVGGTAAPPTASAPVDEAGMLNRQLDAQFSVVENPEGGPEEPGEVAPVPTAQAPPPAPSPATTAPVG